MQKIWLAVWEHIDRVPDDKWHAFLYSVVRRQEKKYIYYATRDNKTQSMVQSETSEGDEFNVIDLYTDALYEADDYLYLELLDAIEDILTEEEMQYFIAYLQGQSKTQMMKLFKVGHNAVRNKFRIMGEKFEKEFGRKATFPNFIAPKVKKVLSEETKEKLRNRTISEETRKKMSASKTGKPQSEETKKKISEAVKKYWEEKRAK